MRSTRLVGLTLAVLGVGCTPALATISEEDVATIRHIEQEFAAATVAQDVDRILSQRTADIVWYAPNAAALNGPDAVRAALAANPPMAKFEVTPVETKGSGDMAYNRGSYVATLVIGADTIVEPGKYAQIWRRESDGNWKIAFEVWNSDTPPPSPQPAPAATR